MDLEIDAMLFYAAIIEQRLEVLDTFPDAEAMFGPGLASIGTAVAEIAHREIEQAQEQLDRLIAEDTTWRPA